MNETNNLSLTQKFFLVAAPVLAASILGVSPSRAATFASSTSEFEFNNFSQPPSTVETFTDTNAVPQVFGEDGIAETKAEADAIFVQVPPIFGANVNLSEASGENQTYSAFADSESRVVGNFEIQADTIFSFDFITDFNLATSIDNLPSENARASGDISFWLLDIENNTILDSFNLAGNIVTKGDNDFVELQASDNVSLNEPFINPNFGGLEESLEVSLSGSFERTFANQTNLALIESKRNTVLAKAPEPSTGLALLLSSSLIGFMLKRKRK
ncbi:MAG: PEP-CTERM sorting domain-containing protein [Cyanobacteriota bacterium]|nr:PEP-CTERM sorting domain-containing protein [Cyanobacteriota bacterium]